jgi:hypothetical protein
LSFHATIKSEEKTYIIEIEKLALNSISISWHRTDGSSDNDNIWYYIEYGIKGFERGEGITYISSAASFTVYYNLVPDTEYSIYIRKETDSEDSPIWFEEHNFKTPDCNTEISNTKEEMEYANGQFIKDLIDVHIICDEVADFYELEYGIKGFEKGKGTIIASSVNRFSIGNENLQPNMEYDYYVRAKCNDIFGEWSEKKKFATTDVFHYFGDEAFDVYFENITNKSAIVEWRKIIGGTYSKSYLVEYGQKGFERGKGQTQSSIMNYIELSGLEPDTEYSFFIRNYGKSLNEPVWLVEHTFKTHPCNTEVSEIKSTEIWSTCYCSTGAVEIEWDAIADSYEFEYGLKGFQKGTGEIIEIKEGNSVLFHYEELNPNTEYDFYIRAKCRDEFGEWTSVNSFSTPEYVSIKNVQNLNFKVFPNPVEDVLNINFNLVFDPENIVVYIFDLTGSIRYKYKYKEKYNVSSLPAGTYIVNIRDEKLSKTMIIQKK